MTDQMICYKHGKIIQCELIQIPGTEFYLEKVCLEYYLKMKNDARKEGIVFVEDTAWRSMEYQSDLYARWKAGTLKADAVAMPGYSNHQNGVCVDLSTNGLGQKSALFKWMAKNAARYFFFNTEKKEPWHWEFIAPKELTQ